MNNDLKRTLIRMLGLSEYKKGENYPKRYVRYEGHTLNNGDPQFNFKVESESSYRYYGYIPEKKFKERSKNSMMFM